jgi:hypothetical protein
MEYTDDQKLIFELRGIADMLESHLMLMKGRVRRPPDLDFPKELRDLADRMEARS